MASSPPPPPPSAASAEEENPNPKTELMKRVRSHEIAIAEINTLPSSRAVYQKSGNIYFRKSIKSAVAFEQSVCLDLLQKHPEETRNACYILLWRTKIAPHNDINCCHMDANHVILIPYKNTEINDRTETFHMLETRFGVRTSANLLSSYVHVT